MCGVAAIFAYHYASSEVDRNELRQIRDAMARRGPDGHGEWFSGDGRTALGHRRLAIIDLSEKGAQPMKSDDGHLIVSFNGEIYNYRQLRESLEAKGSIFRTNSDTEVLLHLYAKKGAEMVHDLRGMFSIILWDEQKKEMLLFRDAYGIKPLYYADDGWTVRVASQVKALLASGKVSQLKEPAGIAGFFLTGSVPEPFTLYQEIRQVPAGSVVLINSLGPSKPKKYFSVSEIFSNAFRENITPTNRLSVQSKLTEALTDSLKHHFVSDVPVGLFLSAGVDSGAIAGLSADMGNKIGALTLSFAEFEGTPQDELPLAQKIANFYGMPHTQRRLFLEEFQQDFDHILASMDQPSIDGINTYFISKAARENGWKVALSGLGGDELFGGYPAFLEVPRLQRWMRLPSRVPFAGDLFRLASSFLVSAGLLRQPKFTGLVKYGGYFTGAYFLKRALFLPWELPALVGHEMAREGFNRLRLRAGLEDLLNPDPGGDFEKIACLESSFYMRNQLLRDADWAGMAHSVEIRVPFVDSFLLEQAVPLLIQSKEANKKFFLTQAPKKNMPALIKRPKTGFSVPINSWLSSDKGADASSWKNVEMLKKPGTHWSRRWAHTVYRKLAA